MRLLFAIRSHRRPAEALKTFMLLRSLLSGVAIRVYVEPEQVDDYKQVFSGFSDCIFQGVLGSGENVWRIVSDSFAEVPLGSPPLGLQICDDNLTAIRPEPKTVGWA